MIKPLSDWYRRGAQQLREWLEHPPPQLTRRLRGKLISAFACCRAGYIDALLAEHGPEETTRILEHEARKPKLKLLR